MKKHSRTVFAFIHLLAAFFFITDCGTLRGGRSYGFDDRSAGTDRYGLAGWFSLESSIVGIDCRDGTFPDG